MLENINIRSGHLDGVEVSWFAPLCSDDYRYLGVPEDHLKSNFENTSKILLTAEKNGFRNILCPSSFQVGQDTLSFASAVAPMTKEINLLAAIRCGEYHPPMLARYIASLDHILKGRLTINIISSDLPGETLASQDRYQRSREVIEILKQCFNQDEVDFEGKFYNIKLKQTDPVKPYQQNGGPLMYFGGYSPSAVELCAEHCDVYLMWPEKQEQLLQHMKRMSDLAANKYDRSLDFGLRVHVIVRETEKEARTYAQSLLSKLNHQKGTEIRERAQDAHSKGVSLQSDLRNEADGDGFVEDHLWTGIGQARSGCGAALVGTPEQILQKLKEYQEMGIRSFVLSGYPHQEECELVGRYIIPHLKTVSFPEEQYRIPKTTPLTPLGKGKRK